MKGYCVLNRILIEDKKIMKKQKESLITMKKRILTTLAVALFTVSAASTAFAHGHGHGGHHGCYYDYDYNSNNQNYYEYQTPTYSAPTITVENRVPLGICDVEGCTIIGGHIHDNWNLVTHYYGDGHSYHDYYDHYYGDGHGYHHAGELHY